MATIKELKKELNGLGVNEKESKLEGILPLKGDEKVADLEAILTAAKVVVGDAPKGSSNQNNDSASSTILVWVKGRTYINDTQRIDGGLYRLVNVPERLAKSSSDVVEVFADSIPPRKLTEIAKWSGVSHPEDFEDAQLLEKIVVSELKPF